MYLETNVNIQNWMSESSLVTEHNRVQCVKSNSMMYFPLSGFFSVVINGFHLNDVLLDMHKKIMCVSYMATELFQLESVKRL